MDRRAAFVIASLLFIAFMQILATSAQECRLRVLEKRKSLWFCPSVERAPIVFYREI